MTRVHHRAIGAPLLSICVTACILAFTSPGYAQADPTEREVSLPELLTFADEHAAAAQLAIVQQGYGDAATAGAGALLRDNPTVAFSIGPRFSGAGAQDVDFVASLAQPVEVAGERGVRMEAAARLAERLDAETAAARWAVRREVTLAYHLAVLARAKVALMETLARFAGEVLATARRRLAAGDATAVDVLVAETVVAQSRWALLGAAQAMRAARLVLADVSGWSIDAPPNVPASLEALRPIPTLAAALRVRAQQHPELLARHAAVAEARAQTELADREAWPAPVFGIEVAREGSARDPASYVVLGTIGMTLPLWQRNTGDRARSRVDESVARAAENGATRALRGRVARAHSELCSAAERIALFTSSVAASLEASLALLQRGFDAGELPLFAVSYAREQLVESQRDALDAYADYYRARAELEFAMGAELPATGAAPTTGGVP